MQLSYIHILLFMISTLSGLAVSLLFAKVFVRRICSQVVETMLTSVEENRNNMPAEKKISPPPETAELDESKKFQRL